MGVKKRGYIDDQSGQMTIEFVVMFPVMVVIAAISLNALLFISECAEFDRVARNAVRVYMTAPGHGQSVDDCCGEVQRSIQAAMDKDYLDTSVSAQESGFGRVSCALTLSYHPNVLGMGLKSSLFGVSIPSVDHHVQMTVDMYRPGVVV